MSTDKHSSEQVEAQLRRALTAEAEMVNPAGDGLGQIRAGIDDRRSRSWWRNPAVAIAAAAVLGLATAAGAVVLNDDGKTDVVAKQSTESPMPSNSPPPSSSPSSSPSESPTVAAGEQVRVPVYYLGPTSSIVADGPAEPSAPPLQDIRLYREFHSVPLLPGGLIETALTEMFTGKAADSDYASIWATAGNAENRGVKVNKVTKTADTVQIDLSKGAAFMSVGSETAELSLQQLVYTVTAADPTVKKVTLRLDGRVVPELWGHIAVGTRAFQRAAAVDVQGLIWLLSPGENAKVGPRVRIYGLGTAFEGTISWEVQKVGGTIVEKGFTQGGSDGTFGEFIDEVLLPPGTYEIRAFENSAEDGRRLHVDDKTFVVE